MINFYRFYNRSGLNKEEYEPLIKYIDCGVYNKYFGNEPIEHIIKKSPKHAYYYAKNIIDDRWIEAEPYIMKDPYYAFLYATDIINGRWIEAESYIKQSEFWRSEYSEAFDIDLV